MALLSVTDLHVSLPTPRGLLPALHGVSFTLERGEVLGWVGESGSGKSLAALAVMGLLPEGAQLQGRLCFDGQVLSDLDERGWGRLRGRRIAMVFQEPMSALNPLHPVGRQVAEPLRWHHRLSAAAAQAEALRLLEQVQLPQARSRWSAYPHELSGGQRQRVLLAVALAGAPDLLITDEPTTALDTVTQRQVLDLIGTLVAERGMAWWLISHHLGVIARHAARVGVLYGGRLVETGPTAALLNQPAHPYTQGLLAARPRADAPPGTRLPGLPGKVPALGEWPAGCGFAPRCPRRQPNCDQPPAERPLGADRRVLCLHPLPGPSA